MGLLNDIVSSLDSKQDGHGASVEQLQVIWQWLQEQGGIQMLLEKFQQSGLGSLSEHWPGAEWNPSGGRHDVQSVLGELDLQSLAGNLGTDEQEASHLLARVLPQWVDKASSQREIDPHIAPGKENGPGSMAAGVFNKR